MKTKCPKCGFELLESEKVCPQCGFFERGKSYRLFQLILSILILVILLAVYLSQFFGNIGRQGTVPRLVACQMGLLKKYLK